MDEQELFSQDEFRSVSSRKLQKVEIAKEKSTEREKKKKKHVCLFSYTLGLFSLPLQVSDGSTVTGLHQKRTKVL